jgi:thymidylate synthase ThyX
MYCNYIATANLLNVLKFIGLRNKPDAQWEIKVLAGQMGKFVEELFPIAWESFNEIIK